MIHEKPRSVKSQFASYAINTTPPAIPPYPYGTLVRYPTGLFFCCLVPPNYCVVCRRERDEMAQWPDEHAPGICKKCDEKMKACQNFRELLPYILRIHSFLKAVGK